MIKVGQRWKVAEFPPAFNLASELSLWFSGIVGRFVRLYNQHPPKENPFIQIISSQRLLKCSSAGAGLHLLACTSFIPSPPIPSYHCLSTGLFKSKHRFSFSITLFCRRKFWIPNVGGFSGRWQDFLLISEGFSFIFCQFPPRSSVNTLPDNDWAPSSWRLSLVTLSWPG